MTRVARRRRTLSLRMWLILTVVAVVGLTGLAELALAFPMSSWQRQADQARLASVRGIIGVDAARWSNPTWQRHAAVALTALGVDLRLVRLRAGGPGVVVFVTAGARRLLDQGASTTTGGQTAPSALDTESMPHMPAAGPAFERIVIPDSAAPTAGGSAPGAGPRGAALLWFTGSAPGAPSPWLWPQAAVVTVILALVIAAWLLGRSVLRPMAAMNRAMEGIAGGDLEVRLPPSRAREVAEVGAALEGMSAALGESLRRQSALEEERQLLDEERKLFIGAVVHDLRTPLFMLRGYLKGLESGVAATPEKRAHYISACRAKADALERLITDLFAFTRLEYLEQQPERAPLELGALLREAAEGVQPLAEAKGVALALDGPAEPCPLAGDAQMLARVAENLLDNALRYTPAGGQISVRWSQEDTTLVFTVADSGPGIAAHDLPHLFTPLYRGETSRNRQTGGAGLGLTIARRILQAHGGDLSAANGATGGAIFTATLPAARHATAPTDLVTVAGS